MCKYAFCFDRHFRVNCDNSLFGVTRAPPYRPFCRCIGSPWFPSSILSSHHLSLILYVAVARNHILWGLDGIYGNLASLYSQLLSGFIINPVGPDSQSLPQPIRTLSAERKPLIRVSTGESCCPNFQTSLHVQDIFSSVYKTSSRNWFPAGVVRNTTVNSDLATCEDDFNISKEALTQYSEPRYQSFE